MADLNLGLTLAFICPVSIEVRCDLKFAGTCKKKLFSVLERGFPMKNVIIGMHII